MAFTTLPNAGPNTALTVPRRPATAPAWHHLDVLLIGAAVAITAIGVLMVYSTTRIPLGVAGDNPESQMKK
jgi:hypothetical protein